MNKKIKLILFSLFFLQTQSQDPEPIDAPNVSNLEEIKDQPKYSENMKFINVRPMMSSASIAMPESAVQQALIPTPDGHPTKLYR